MLVYGNILFNNGFVMPCSMNIDNYSIFFLDNVDIDLLVFLEFFRRNEGVDMVSHLTVFIHSAHALHISFQRHDILYLLFLVFDYSSLGDNTIIQILQVSSSDLLESHLLSSFEAAI
jgi:hypothetical protein